MCTHSDTHNDMHTHTGIQRATHLVVGSSGRLQTGKCQIAGGMLLRSHRASPYSNNNDVTMFYSYCNNEYYRFLLLSTSVVIAITGYVYTQLYCCKEHISLQEYFPTSKNIAQTGEDTTQDKQGITTRYITIRNTIQRRPHDLTVENGCVKSSRKATV